MPIKQTVPYSFGTFFITFSCHNWLPLIDKVDGYDIVYKCFDYLKTQGHFVNAFVVMPNHVHPIISFIHTDQSIDIIVGNGKRFMVYDIIKRLKEKKHGSLN
jgi:REP element-mobilizing transposase RayT